MSITISWFIPAAEFKYVRPGKKYHHNHLINVTVGGEVIQTFQNVGGGGGIEQIHTHTDTHRYTHILLDTCHHHISRVSCRNLEILTTEKCLPPMRVYIYLLLYFENSSRIFF